MNGNEETARAVLAGKPDGDLMHKIDAFAESRGCKRVHYTIDPNIIGGIIIYIGDIIYDGSVRSRLNNIKRSL